MHLLQMREMMGHMVITTDMAGKLHLTFLFGFSSIGFWGFGRLLRRGRILSLVVFILTSRLRSPFRLRGLHHIHFRGLGRSGSSRESRRVRSKGSRSSRAKVTPDCWFCRSRSSTSRVCWFISRYNSSRACSAERDSQNVGGRSQSIGNSIKFEFRLNPEVPTRYDPTPALSSLSCSSHHLHY